MKCEKCGAQLDGNQPFCLNCGAEVGKICPSCETINSPNSEFCSKCGWPFEEDVDNYFKEEPLTDVEVNKNTGLIVTIVALGFILIAVIAVLTFFLINNNSAGTEVNIPEVGEENTSGGGSTPVTPKTPSTPNNPGGNYNPSDNYSDPISPSPVTTSTRIVGNSGTTQQELVSFYNAQSPISFPSYYENRGVTLSDFAQMYVEECNAENIRADLAFCQMIHETGWLQFGGDVQINQFNFAGLGATGGGEPGIDFAARYGDNRNGVRMGIRAQVQHLKAYGSTQPLNNTCIDERFDLVERGSAPTIGDLSGRWSTDSRFGSEIVDIMNRM